MIDFYTSKKCFTFRVKNRNEQIKVGYVYFIYNKTKDRIYVGSTCMIKRMLGYEDLYRNKKSSTSSVSSYNKTLVRDLINGDEFSFSFISTNKYVELEKMIIKIINKKKNMKMYNLSLYENYKFQAIKFFSYTDEPIFKTYNDVFEHLYNEILECKTSEFSHITGISNEGFIRSLKKVEDVINGNQKTPIHTNGLTDDDFNMLRKFFDDDGKLKNSKLSVQEYFIKYNPGDIYISIFNHPNNKWYN
jgi:hypothetical protein